METSKWSRWTFFLGLQAFAYCVHFNQKGELYGFQHLLSG